MAYLSVAAIESSMRYLSSAYPSLCQLITAAEPSVQGRAIHAIKLASGTGPNRRGMLALGGVHARELVNPDMLVTLALRMCQSYTNGTDIVLGGRTYAASTVKLILDSMDLYLLPLVNPDGREWVQSPAGYAMWRKNRSVNAGSQCRGVDLNRNYDFLFSSGIGTSNDPCSDTFRGPSAFSEPETRNVRWMLDTFSNIRGMIDVHSYSELILHPWGDDATQTTDPGQNFANPTFDGMRGDPDDTIYSEYMRADDLNWFVNTGNAMRDAIAGVRGHLYTVEPAVLLYPTSGTSKDYGYARHLVDTGKSKVYAYTMETGRDEFQPPASEAAQVVNEGCAGVLQFSLSVLCLADSLAAQEDADIDLDALRFLREHTLAGSVSGRRYIGLLAQHTPVLAEALATDGALRDQCVVLLRDLRPALATEQGGGEPLSDDLIRRLDELAARFVRRPGLPHSLTAAIDDIRADLPHFRGRPITEGLHELDRRVTIPGRLPGRPKHERVPARAGATVPVSDGMPAHHRAPSGAWPR